MKLLLIIIITLFTTSNIFAEKRWVQSKLPKEAYEEYVLLKCLDSSSCFAIADLPNNITVYKTLDQGLSWQVEFEKNLTSNTGLRNVFKCFITDTNNIYITYTDKVALELSYDGGKNFRIEWFSDLSKNQNDLFFNLAFYTNNISAGITRNALVFTSDN